MPETRAALDSLVARLLRTESLATIAVLVVAAVGELEAAGIITSGGAAVALTLGRSFAKGK